MKSYSRRNFLKLIAAGAGSAATTFGAKAAASGAPGPTPQRPFGRTGIDVSTLSFGGSLDVSFNRLLLKQAVKLGVTYWDTAASYMGGNSERGFGKYFDKYPADRKNIFLVTKSHGWTVKAIDRDLNRSLDRMKTDYVDLFFVHGIYNIDAMDDEIKHWSEKAKSAGKIRLIGFSTHSNMEECLLAAPKLGWIDGIMMTYNYRLMHTDRMRRAVDACVEAGIGLTAMKTQGGGQVRSDSETELKLAGRFLEKGFTDAQAKLKAVWENPHIASICSEMPNTTILTANAAAARDRTSLSADDNQLLQQHAGETASAYCTGCTHICEPAVQGKVPIGDIMRCLMYSRSYGSRHRARNHFNSLSPDIREVIREANFTEAEQKCPQRMAITKLMREAVEEL